MLSDVLKLGDKIDVTHIDKYNRPTHNAKTYASQLVDFIEFDVIHIATPISSSTPVILNVGENYRLCFYTSKGLFQSSCVILKNLREGNIIIAVVRITSNLEKYQRRQYYRLECIQNIKYRIISKEEELINNRLKVNDFRSEEEGLTYKTRLDELTSLWSLGTIKDLSGGGTRFTSETQHSKGDKIKLQLELEVKAGIKSLFIEAIIVDTYKVFNKVGLYEHRAEYNDISKKDREELINYIFEQERKMKKRVN